MHAPLAVATVAPAMADLAAFVAAGLAIGAVVFALRRWRQGPEAADDDVTPPPSTPRRRDLRWRAAVALAAGVAAAAVLMPALVALRQLYPLPGVGAKTVAVLLVLLMLLVGALLALLLADPDEET